MPFDMEPDHDVHTECRREIHEQATEIERLQGICRGDALRELELNEKIEQLQGDLDRRMGRRSDCTVCGEKVPFVGAVFCSEACWREAVSNA